MPQLVLATALHIEARAIARAFNLPPKLNNNIQNSPRLALALIGPGAGHLDLIRPLLPQALILAGLAGALAPQLHLGDVVVHGDVPSILPGLPHRVFVGPIATSETILATPAQKAQLYRQTGALAVDMETAHAQFLAQSLQIPFLVVRAISDTAAQPLAPDLLTLVDPYGRPRIARALALLARHPARLRELLALQRATKRALTNLTTTLVALVRTGWPRTL